jgi:hypothetical protein
MKILDEELEEHLRAFLVSFFVASAEGGREERKES